MPILTLSIGVGNGIESTSIQLKIVAHTGTLVWCLELVPNGDSVFLDVFYRLALVYFFHGVVLLCTAIQMELEVQ